MTENSESRQHIGRLEVLGQDQCLLLCMYNLLTKVERIPGNFYNCWHWLLLDLVTLTSQAQ